LGGRRRTRTESSSVVSISSCFALHNAWGEIAFFKHSERTKKGRGRRLKEGESKNGGGKSGGEEEEEKNENVPNRLSCER
jgi:hypothetical protein